MSLIDKLNFSKEGLIPAVIQDDKTGKVLTLCYMNKDALEKSLSEGRIYVYRRSKGRVMLKGETSGCIQSVNSLYVDCANNSLLFRVDQKRAACHKGYFSCYFNEIDRDGNSKIVEEKIFDPKEVYGT